jgi:hypothetical protein
MVNRMSVAIRARTRATSVEELRADAARIGTVAGFVVVLVGVLAMHGFLWGHSEAMIQTLLDAGAIKCLHNQGLGALSAHCNAVGLPTGMTFVTGMPEIMLGWLLSWIPGVDAWAAHQMLNVILDAVALAGGYLLLRRWSVPRPIALFAAGVYLVSPSILGLNGFLYTFTGYTFLPLYVWLFLRALDRFGEGNRNASVAYVAGVTFLMVFTDGYSYATALLLLACLLVWWLVGHRDVARGPKLLALGTFVVANIVAVAAYTAYVNVPSEHYELGRFRFLSLDPATLFIPQATLIWPSHIGYTPPTLRLWGDGSNYLHNYMGFGMIAVVVWLLVAARRPGRSLAHRAEIMALFVGASLALVFALGPALKFDSHWSGTPGVQDMPLHDAVVGLPTSLLYAHVTPFVTMRAVFRWSLAFRFFLVFAAAVATGTIWRSGKRVLAVAIIAVASLEILPSPQLYWNAWRRQATMVTQVRTQLISEFADLTHRNERVLVLPASNDFLANVMAPFAHVRTYNVGVDKSYFASHAKWPRAVSDASGLLPNPSGQGDRIAAVLRHDADAVVISYVDLGLSTNRWPAPAPNVAYLRQQATALSRDPRFATRSGKLMTIVRLAHDSPAARPR